MLQAYPNSGVIYERLLSTLPDNEFDWFLVDGANRNLCIEVGAKKLKSGGFMVVDNYDHEVPERFITDMEIHMRTEYCSDLIRELFEGWEEHVFDADDWPGKGTIVFVKP